MVCFNDIMIFSPRKSPGTGPGLVCNSACPPLRSGREGQVLVDSVRNIHKSLRGLSLRGLSLRVALSGSRGRGRSRSRSRSRGRLRVALRRCLLVALGRSRSRLCIALLRLLAVASIIGLALLVALLGLCGLGVAAIILAIALLRLLALLCVTGVVASVILALRSLLALLVRSGLPQPNFYPVGAALHVGLCLAVLIHVSICVEVTCEYSDQVAFCDLQALCRLAPHSDSYKVGLPVVSGPPVDRHCKIRNGPLLAVAVDGLFFYVACGVSANGCKNP